MDERRDRAHHYIVEHPGSSVMEVAAALFSEKVDSVGKARKLLEQLEARQLVQRHVDQDGPITYTAVPPQEETADGREESG